MADTHEDAERLAQRYCEIRELLSARRGKDPEELVCLVFDEMLKAQLLFPGPSLYADM